MSNTPPSADAQGYLENLMRAGQDAMKQFDSALISTMGVSGKAPSSSDNPLSPFTLVADLQREYFKQLWQFWNALFLRSFAGGEHSGVGLAQGDKRFKDESWREQPYYDLLKQSYLLGSRQLHEFVDRAQVDDNCRSVRTSFVTPTSFCRRSSGCIPSLLYILDRIRHWHARCRSTGSARSGFRLSAPSCISSAICRPISSRTERKAIFILTCRRMRWSRISISMRIRAQLAWLKDALADGRKFILGDTPGALDLGYFHPISLVRKNAPAAAVDALLGLAPIVAWYERMAHLGHGKPTEMTAEAALAAAKVAKPMAVTHIKRDDDAMGLKPGNPVTVTPDDNAKVPVKGTLVAADANKIILHHANPQTGDIHVHFPRAGFELEAA